MTRERIMMSIKLEGLKEEGQKRITKEGKDNTKCDSKKKKHGF
jgi:hypothetical protein